MKMESLGIPRHWWGKIIGGALGLMKGGLSGALIGAFIGHFADRFFAGLNFQKQARSVFLNSLFSCLGHLNKVDGVVTQAEIRAAEELMRRLQLDADERREAIACFNRGKSPDFDVEACLYDFNRHTGHRQDLRQMFIEILMEGAAGDGKITQAERDVLYRVARSFRIPGTVFAAMFSAFTATHGSGGYTGPQAAASSLEQAFATLGLKQSASDAEVKRAYRKLVGQYHPDRLISQGLPEEMMEKAKTRVREINGAYDQIKQSRGIK